MMANVEGVDLIPIENHVNVRHELFTEDDNLFPVTVNSFHDYAIITCPDNYKVIATSKNGCIEAISHKLLPWEGWMWHPEREEIFSEIEINRINHLFVRREI